MKAAIAALALTLLATGALAQTPAPASEPETIYSNAQRTKDELLSRKFVQSLLSPSLNLEGQFSRWKKPICPRVAGMTPLAAHMVERRIRDIAQQIGAPLDRADPCRPNIIVFVSPQPQATLDSVVARNHWLFDGAPVRELKVHYPVQAWYEGLYRDFNGVMHRDLPWENSLRLARVAAAGPGQRHQVAPGRPARDGSRDHSGGRGSDKGPHAG